MFKTAWLVFIGLGVAFLPVFAVIGPDPSPNAPRDLTPPANPTAVALGSDGVKLQLAWVDPPDQDFWRVEILRNDGGGTPVTGVVRAIVEKGVQRFSDLEVQAQERYCYQLRVSDFSFNTGLSSEYCGVVEVVPPSPAPAVQTPPAAAPELIHVPAPRTTPAVAGVGEDLQSGNHAYGFARVRTLTTEQVLARALARHLDEVLPGVFNRLFHQSTATSKQWWYTYVNAYVYGGYTFAEIKQAVRFGGKTVHPTIPAVEWRGSPDYQAYISR